MAELKLLRGLFNPQDGSIIEPGTVVKVDDEERVAQLIADHTAVLNDQEEAPAPELSVVEEFTNGESEYKHLVSADNVHSYTINDTEADEFSFTNAKQNIAREKMEAEQEAARQAQAEKAAANPPATEPTVNGQPSAEQLQEDFEAAGAVPPADDKVTLS